MAANPVASSHDVGILVKETTPRYIFTLLPAKDEQELHCAN